MRDFPKIDAIDSKGIIGRLMWKLANKEHDVRSLKRRIMSPASKADQFDAIRKYYEACDYGGVDFHIYDVDWFQVFTPIENLLWQDLRCKGVDMRPQYPVGRFFVDFGDPELRIAVEADGRDWHDRERDRERDYELAELGWSVFRVTGSECHRTLTDNLDKILDDRCERGIQVSNHRYIQWAFETSDGVAAALGLLFYGRGLSYLHEEDAWKVLEAHSLCPGWKKRIAHAASESLHEDAA